VRVRIVWVDGPAEGWLHVVVRAKTRIVYKHQYGGVMCRHGEVQGYLVPVFGTEALAELRDFFEGTLGTYGTTNHDGVPFEWREDQLDLLRRVVSRIAWWADDDLYPEPVPIVLDESRIQEFDEAWLPVLTPDGPGVLWWSNSD
jgi:hypothetical protein